LAIGEKDLFDVMIDYAHNAAGLMAVKDYLHVSSYQYKVGIIASMGDRRVQDNQEMGRIAAEIFDQIIIREDADLRDRKPGETIEIIKQGIASAAYNPKVTAIAEEKKALSHAIENAVPDSLILHCTEKVDEILAYVKQQQERYQKSQLLSRKNMPAH
jgi:cyanophycin synthetase